MVSAGHRDRSVLAVSPVMQSRITEISLWGLLLALCSVSAPTEEIRNVVPAGRGTATWGAKPSRASQGSRAGPAGEDRGRVWARCVPCRVGAWGLLNSLSLN